jgi:hypothetical protein
MKKYIYFILLFFIRCQSSETNNHSNLTAENVSKSVIGEDNYRAIYQMICDSFKVWVAYHLPSYDPERIYLYKVDSKIFFNNEKNRLIGCSHL